MKKNYKIGNVKVDQDLKNKVSRAINKLNENAILEITTSSFIRISLRNFSEMVLSDDFNFDLIIQKNTK